MPLDHPVLRAHLADALARLAEDAGEITDRGYINQRVVLDRRADLVERLYADEQEGAIIQPAREIN